jgi:folate-binding protein YgfZ
MPLSLLTALNDGCFYIEHNSPTVFRFSGPDHLRYLHNRLTQDIRSLTNGGGAKSLCLSPNGRIQGQIVVLKNLDSIDVLAEDLNNEQNAELKASILQFKVADQVEFTDVSANMCQLTLIGAGLKSLAAFIGLSTDSEKRYSHFSRVLSGNEITIIHNSILGFEIVELIGSTTALEELKLMSSAFGVEKLPSETKELLRILDKNWLFGVDVDDKTLAAEVDLEHSVSFKKGCYPGQEVVEMSISRGRPNRTLSVLAVEDRIVQPLEVTVGAKSAGTVTSSIYNEEEGVTFFLSRLKTEFLESQELMVGGNPCKILTKEVVNSKAR